MKKIPCVFIRDFTGNPTLIPLDALVIETFRFLEVNDA